jgi:hypothetical protein
MNTRIGITNVLTLPLLIFLSSTSLAQDKSDQMTDSIIKEGKELYKSEMASWYGTDIFLERFKDQKQNMGGYFSYQENNLTNCIFFAKGENPKVLGTIKFDSTYNVNKAQVDSQPRAFTIGESDIYTIRQLALKEIAGDTLFKTYKDTRLNIVPLIYKGQKKVYILTGSQVGGVVVFGNDYLLSFDINNKLIEKRQLHKNIMLINYGKAGDSNVVASVHSHLPETGDFITSTDICTLMLYEKFAKWKQHIVISKGYISIWDCEKNELLTLTREAWDRIYKDQKERHKDN